MAKSKYEYVKNFELDDKLLPNTWLVVRIDGRSFHKFSSEHKFEKPNDKRALDLMNISAMDVMKQISDIIFAYGQSDEYSFIFNKDSRLYQRRSSKISSAISSIFTASYVFNWSRFFPETPLTLLPSFDSRCVCYPSLRNLRDYVSWRQVDCHINNLYNTTFWSFVLKGGLSEIEAEERIRDTISSEKNEILFTQFGLNYNSLPSIYRKGSIVLRRTVEVKELSKSGTEIDRKRPSLQIEHFDLISDDEFWSNFKD